MAKKNKSHKTLTINAPIDIKLGDLYDYAEVLCANTNQAGMYVWLILHNKDEDCWYIECVDYSELPEMESLDELPNEYNMVFDSKEELVLFYQALNKWIGKNG